MWIFVDFCDGVCCSISLKLDLVYYQKLVTWVLFFAAVTIFSPCNNNTILFTLLSSRNTAALTKLYTLIIIPQFADDSLVLYLNGISNAL